MFQIVVEQWHSYIENERRWNVFLVWILFCNCNFILLLCIRFPIRILLNLKIGIPISFASHFCCVRNNIPDKISQCAWLSPPSPVCLLRAGFWKLGHGSLQHPSWTSLTFLPLSQLKPPGLARLLIDSNNISFFSLYKSFFFCVCVCG